MHPKAGVGRRGCVLAIAVVAALCGPPVASAVTVQLPRGATAVLSGGSGDDNGESVAGAGDFNADGYQDVIRGASGADPGSRSGAGSATVTFGPIRSLPSATFQTQMFGDLAGDNAGQSVAGAGDFNGDGRDDVIVGAPGATPGGATGAGSSYVVFGSASPPANVALATLTPAQGFRIDGADAGDDSGRSVAGAGDVDGDGLDDVIVGAHL